MPVENERKYVLRRSDRLPSDFRELLWSYPHAKIEQSYLVKQNGTSVRIRKSERHDGDIAHLLTVKKTVKGKIIEIETEISDEDYDALRDHTNYRVRKTRFYMDGWEVDFFLDKNDEIYFVMAEIELDEDIDKPETILEYVQDRLLYEVPRSENSVYSSRKIASVPYAKEIWSNLEKKQKIKSLVSIR